MIVTTEWMSSKYNEFNLKYWDGALPRINFKTNKSSKTWGFASSRPVSYTTLKMPKK